MITTHVTTLLFLATNPLLCRLNPALKLVTMLKFPAPCLPSLTASIWVSKIGFKDIEMPQAVVLMAEE